MRNLLTFCTVLLSVSCQKQQDVNNSTLNTESSIQPSIAGRTIDKREDIIKIFNAFATIEDSIKASLIKRGEFYASTSDESEIEVYKMYSNTAGNALRVENYYEGGPSASSIYEYKIVETSGGSKVLVSKYVGTPSFTTQARFDVYSYDAKAKAFSLDSASMKLFEIELKDFFLTDTPDSVIDNYRKHSSNFFNIFHVEKGIVAERMLVDELSFNDSEEVKWLQGKVIRVELKNGSFIRSLPFFE